MSAICSVPYFSTSARPPRLAFWGRWARFRPPALPSGPSSVTDPPRACDALQLTIDAPGGRWGRVNEILRMLLNDRLIDGERLPGGAVPGELRRAGQAGLRQAAP